MSNSPTQELSGGRVRLKPGRQPREAACGSTLAYRNGCRCDDCKAAEAAYRKLNRIEPHEYRERHTFIDPHGDPAIPALVVECSPAMARRIESFYGFRVIA